MLRVDQKRILKLTPYDEALKKLFEIQCIKPMDYEMVSVESSMGRVLAEDVASEVDIPQTDRALVDGYALKSEDTLEASPKNPITLKIVGKLYPWSLPCHAGMSNGQVVYVTCGAPIPYGADAVVKVENTILCGDEIKIRYAIKAGDNIAPAGEDIKKGSVILRKGKILRPQDIGVLAGIGVSEVKVLKKPRVAIIATGNELFELSKRDPTKIVDNYALIVSSLIWDLGGLPIRLGISPDDPSEIKRKISEAIEKADIIVTIGGCSVGEKDFVPDAINSLGKPGLIVHGIRVKPGKVTGFGVVKGKPIVMLPGLIASTLAGFYLILAPLIGLYMGLGMDNLIPIVVAKMNQDLSAETESVYRFMPVRVRKVNGELIVDTVPGGSGVLSRFIRSNGFILLSPKEVIKKGDKVKVTLFSKEEFTSFVD